MMELLFEPLEARATLLASCRGPCEAATPAAATSPVCVLERLASRSRSPSPSPSPLAAPGPPTAWHIPRGAPRTAASFRPSSAAPRCRTAVLPAAAAAAIAGKMAVELLHFDAARPYLEGLPTAKLAGCCPVSKISNATFHATLCRSLALAAEQDAALCWLSETLRTYPDSLVCKVWLGVWLTACDLPALAMAPLDAAIAEQPNKPDLYLLAACCLLKARRSETAEEYAAESWRRSRSHPHYAEVAARIQFARAAFGQAGYARAASAMAPLLSAQHNGLSTPASRFNVYAAALLLGDRLTSAHDALAAELRQRPNNAMGHYLLGECLAASQRPEAAAQHFAMAVRQRPHDAIFAQRRLAAATSARRE